MTGHDKPRIGRSRWERFRDAGVIPDAQEQGDEHLLALLDVVGIALKQAEQALERAEAAITEGVARRGYPPRPELLEKAKKYAGWAEDLAARLRRHAKQHKEP